MDGGSNCHGRSRGMLPWKGKHLILLLMMCLPLRSSNSVRAARPLSDHIKRSEASCRQINLSVWGGAEQAWIEGEPIHLAGPEWRWVKGIRGGEGVVAGKIMASAARERSGRGRGDWAVDLGNVIRPERKRVYVIACKIRAILWKAAEHYGLPGNHMRWVADMFKWGIQSSFILFITAKVPSVWWSALPIAI